MSQRPRPAPEPPLGLSVFPDRYEITGVIEQTPVALNALGYDPSADSEVFLKAKSRDYENADQARLLEIEADALESLEHPQIPTLVAADTDAEVPYLVMERLPNDADLPRWFKNNSDPFLASRLLVSSLDPLQHIHDRGLVHGEIKTKNLTLPWHGEVGIVDFENAVRLDQPDRYNGLKEGDVRGSIAYMPPELSYDSRVATPQSDIYAAGIVLYELLSGRKPFFDRIKLEVIFQHVFDDPEFYSARQRGVPESLISVVGIAMNKRPEDRFSSATAMSEAIRSAVPTA